MNIILYKKSQLLWHLALLCGLPVITSQGTQAHCEKSDGVCSKSTVNKFIFFIYYLTKPYSMI
jgi:hypothetical protein